MRAPAFQFYVDDFIGGTVDLSAEDVGAYMRLLCYQWNRGSIPQEAAILARIAGCDVSIAVLSKFLNGRNARLEAEREKQREFREAKAKAGQKGAKTRWEHGTAIVLPMANGMANDSSPSPSPLPVPSSLPTSNVKARFAPPTLEMVRLQCAKIGLAEIEADRFFNHYTANGWKVGKNQMRSWPHALSNWKLNSQNYGHNAGTNTGTTSEKILWKAELDRVEKAIKAINDSYEGHMEKTAEDRTRLKQLKERKADLLKFLGFQT